MAQIETVYTEDSKEYYRQALTYWLAALKHGMDSRIAEQELAVLEAYEADAISRGATRPELYLLNISAKVNIADGHR